MMDRSGAEAPLAELLDPDLERRLREARVRRAEAISRRSAGPRETVCKPIPAGPPHPSAAYDQQDAPAVKAHTAAAANASDWRQSLPILGMIFLAGLGIGGIVVGVVALRTLPSRIPVIASTEPTTATAAPSPVPPNVPAQQASLTPASPAESEPASPARFRAFATQIPAGLTEPAHESMPPAAESPVVSLESQRPVAPQPRQALSAADVEAALAVPKRRKLNAADVQAALAALARSDGKRRR